MFLIEREKWKTMFLLEREKEILALEYIESVLCTELCFSESCLHVRALPASNEKYFVHKPHCFPLSLLQNIFASEQVPGGWGRERGGKALF